MVTTHSSSATHRRQDRRTKEQKKTTDTKDKEGLGGQERGSQQQPSKSHQGTLWKRCLAIFFAFGACLASFLIVWKDDSNEGGVLGILARAKGSTLAAKLEQFPVPGVPSVLITGLAAKRSLSKGELILSVPIRYMLHKGTIDQRVHDACREALKGGCQDMTGLILGLALEARNPRAEFASYIESLPKHVPNFLNFRPEQLQLIQIREGGLFAKVISRRMEEGLRAGSRFHPPLQDAELAWAYSVVQSRAFDCDVGDSTEKMLMPGFDLLNHEHAEEHSSSPRCDVVADDDAAERWCWTTATRPLAQGQQIWGFYGDLSNLDLMIFYGFTASANPNGPRLHGLFNDSFVEGVLPWIRGLKCSAQTFLRGPILQHADNGWLRRVEMRCVYFAYAFTSFDEAERSLSDGAEDCLQISHGDDDGARSRCSNANWHHAAAKAHSAIHTACSRLVRRYQNMTVVLDKVSKFKDPITLQLLPSLLEEFEVATKCANHHGSAAEAAIAASRSVLDT